MSIKDKQERDGTQELGGELPPEAWNDTRAEYPRSRCVHQLFEEQAQRTPEAVAVVFEDQQLTYGQLNERANKLAAALRQLGVGPDVLVGLCMLRSLEMVIGLYAIHKAGGAYVPLDPGYPPERLGLMLEDSQAPVVVTQEALRESLPPTRAKMLCVDAPEQETGDRQRATGNTPSLTSDNLAYVIYTSGSTGRPKGVMVQHRNVVNFFTGMDQAIGREPGVWLAVTSISFDISVLELFWTLTRGFKVVLQGDSDAGGRLGSLRQQKSTTRSAPFSVAEQIRRHGVTHLQCTPSLAGMMTQDPQSLPALRQVKRLLFGGEALPSALVEQLGGSSEIFNMYGPTETTVWSSVHRVTRNGGKISIGRPIANTEIYILDEQLRQTPVGAPGELYIGGDGVARGYLNRPELTAERFIQNPFRHEPGARLYRTGDLARYQKDGTIDYLGRTDHQVKIRGFRIEPGEIEAALRQHPEVRESAVSVWEAGANDKRLAGYFVPQPGSKVEAGELRRFLRSKLPEYMVPAVLTSLEEMPLTPNGKIDRKALPVPKAGRPAPEPVKTIPLTEAQREIWYGSQMSDAESCSFNLSVMMKLRGRLDVGLLRESLQWLVEKNEALRVTFSGAGDVQHIQPAMRLNTPVEDLSSLPEAARQEQLEERLKAAVDKPFDLVRGPLLRAQVLKLAAEEHALLLTVHHVVCDGCSLSILIQKLEGRYSARMRGESGEAEPGTEPVSFSEFVLGQNAARNSPERAAAEIFWLGQYARPAPVLALPTDRPRRAKRDFTGGTETIKLNGELSQELKRLSARRRCTLVTTLLAGYYLLLHRVSGQEEIVVGLPMTSRLGEREELLVGHCVNFLPLRLSLEGDPTFVEHLERVRHLMLAAHEHNNFTLGSLLQKLNLPRVPGRVPLAPVMFNLDWVWDEVRLEGVETEIVANPHCYCSFDLSFSLAESQGTLKLHCQYSAELFKPKTIQRWLQLYQALLAAIVANPGQRLSELPRLEKAERPLQNDSAEPRAPSLEELSLEAEEREPTREPISDKTPLSPTEETLAQIWCEVIILEEVGRHDNFFDLGGHSLLATQVIARITKAFNVELPVRTIFETPTVAGLALAVSQAQREQPGGSSIITRRERGNKASKLQEKLEQLSDAELQELLQDPDLKDILS